eukprot:3711878-Amphidinium_carterae.1
MFSYMKSPCKELAVLCIEFVRVGSMPQQSAMKLHRRVGQFEGMVLSQQGLPRKWGSSPGTTTSAPRKGHGVQSEQRTSWTCPFYSSQCASGEQTGFAAGENSTGEALVRGERATNGLTVTNHRVGEARMPGPVLSAMHRKYSNGYWVCLRTWQEMAIWKLAHYAEWRQALERSVRKEVSLPSDTLLDNP